MNFSRLRCFGLVLGVGGILVGCQDKKAQARIIELEKDLAELKIENARLGATRYNEGAPPIEIDSPAEDEVASDLKRSSKDEIEQLKKELARLKQVEAAAKKTEKLLVAAKSQEEREKNNEVVDAPKSILFDATGSVLPAFSNSIMIVEGDQSVGTGFVVKMDGRVFLYTCAHVLSGNTRFVIKNAAGRTFSQFGSFEYADGADMVRLEMFEPIEPALSLADSNTTVALQSEIAAMGNGGGKGVVALEQGTVLGISGDMIEVNAGVIEGSSGGPIIDKTTGRVLGMVTHLSTERDDIWSEGSRLGEVRRFACRLNKAWPWKKMAVTAFLAESKSAEIYDELTRVLYATAALSPTVYGMRLDTTVGGSQTVQSILLKNAKMPLVNNILQMNKTLAAKRMTLSEFDLKKKFRGVLSEAISLGQRNHSAIAVEQMSWYHRKQMPPSVKARETVLRMLFAQMENLK